MIMLRNGAMTSGMNGMFVNLASRPSAIRGEIGIAAPRMGSKSRLLPTPMAGNPLRWLAYKQSCQDHY